MNLPGDDSKKPTEEVSVTEVSDSVLAELSDIFGTGKPDAIQAESPTPVDDATTRALPTDDSTPTEMVVITDNNSHDSLKMESAEALNGFDSGEIIFADSSVGIPVDPLLRPLSGVADVINIFDDNDGAVVIDADLMDRVVIVDDDRPDPTFEERRRRRERRERLKRVKWLKLAGVMVGVVVLVMAILSSPLFAIRHVDFEGTVYTSTKTLTAVKKSLKGASVFTVDTAKARSRILQDPWVADVRITTSFPGRALVEVSERVPVVWYVGDDQKARMVDARGHVIDVLTGWPTKYLQVQGVGPSLDAGAIADDAYRAAAQLVLALPDEIRPKVKSLDLSAGGELSMILKGNTVVRFGPPTDLQNKLVAVVVLLRRQDPATLAVVDVSTGEPTVQTR
ncbi:MAG: FtsQ-type POTRA domain-containing protein [Actinomycetes bacterium]